jgi:hypothetical protein
LAVVVDKKGGCYAKSFNYTPLCVKVRIDLQQTFGCLLGEGTKIVDHFIAHGLGMDGGNQVSLFFLKLRERHLQPVFPFHQQV